MLTDIIEKIGTKTLKKNQVHRKNNALFHLRYYRHIQYTISICQNS
jgi:hypothetical protein